jgi:hypothetical protein
MLPASGLPVSSVKGCGFPGLIASSKPTRMRMQADRIEIPINIIRPTFRVNDGIESRLFLFPVILFPPYYSARGNLSVYCFAVLRTAKQKAIHILY